MTEKDSEPTEKKEKKIDEYEIYNASLWVKQSIEGCDTTSEGMDITAGEYEVFARFITEIMKVENYNGPSTTKSAMVMRVYVNFIADLLKPFTTPEDSEHFGFGPPSPEISVVKSLLKRVEHVVAMRMQEDSFSFYPPYAGKREEDDDKNGLESPEIKKIMEKEIKRQNDEKLRIEHNEKVMDTLEKYLALKIKEMEKDSDA